MGHWKRLIKIPGGTNCYYCINHLRCSTHGYYCPFLFVTLPDMLSILMSPVYLIALLDICYTPCDDTLFMYMYTLHCIYSALCIRCRLHYCICTTQKYGYVAYCRSACSFPSRYHYTIVFLIQNWILL